MRKHHWVVLVGVILATQMFVWPGHPVWDRFAIALHGAGAGLVVGGAIDWVYETW